MKVLHCCLSAFYIDDFGYQENILPKHHKNLGMDVKILASTETYINKTYLGYIEPSTYETKDGIPITRIPYKGFLPQLVMKKLRIYKNLYSEIENYKPDVIFLHDCMFLGIYDVIKYKKRHPNVTIYIDSHTDFVNSAKTWVSKNILHRLLYKRGAKAIEKYTMKFYGTLPTRNEFLEKFYEITSSKIELLPFGVDDLLFNWNEKNSIREKMRFDLGINKTDFVIITGGKIDVRKNIHYLLDAFSSINEMQISKPVKLIVFGKPVDELKEKIHAHQQNRNIIFKEWLPANEIYKYFFASDLAFFPGTHSTLWEEAVGTGLPAVFQHWKGITHLNVADNCIFIKDGKNLQEIKDTILEIVNDHIKFAELKLKSEEFGPKYFSYSQIAKQSLK